MVDIYICEDNEMQRNHVLKVVKNTLLIEEMDMRIAICTPDPEEVLKKANISENVGLYFLDIDLNASMNGLALAQKIRKFDPRCFIVFVTTHSEMSYMSFQYKVEAMDFILKDDIQGLDQKIRDCILKVEERYSSIKNSVNKTFTIKLNTRKITIRHDEILFFETSPNIHKVILHAKSRTLEFTAKLKDIEDELKKPFYRCHRSYLVNTDNIEEVDVKKRVIKMVNGETCLVSVRMIKGLDL